MMARRRALVLAASACGLAAWGGWGGALAQPSSDAMRLLREFVSRTQSGSASFTQTVTSPDGKRQRVSTGSFEFQRPNRFRFEYRKPLEQLIVADGQKVWVFDRDLNQASSRRLGAALGATPAALLAGGAIERDFELSPQPDAAGLQWVLATPRQRDGAIASLRVAFRGRDLAALEVLDNFGQRSLMQFEQWRANTALAPERFVFTPPAGADVIEQ